MQAPRISLGLLKSRALLVAALIALTAFITTNPAEGTASNAPATASADNSTNSEAARRSVKELDPAPVDVAAIKVVNTAEKVTFRFAYNSVFVREEGASGAPYWWGADILLDTNAKKAGPEFAALLTNQCGDGYTVTEPNRDPSKPDRWAGGCGEAARCASTATFNYDAASTSISSISFRKVKGCYAAKRVRVHAEFRTGSYGADPTSPSNGYDALDQFPATTGKYTRWTRTKMTRLSKDKTDTFVKARPSLAP